MDIIASHQSGLAEQLELEAAALAGGPRDAGQRAIVYYHVADMLAGAHAYALLAAAGALAIAPAQQELERAARRSWWRLKRDERAQLAARILAFGATLRALDARRCAQVLMAYRLAATPGLHAIAEQRLDPAVIAALRAVQSERGLASAAVRRALFEAHAAMVEDEIGAALDAAIATLAWPLAPRFAAAAVAALRIAPAAFDRAERRGLARVERRLRAARALPPGFAANPAQAFFALQRQVAERRRRSADVDTWSPDETVSLAA